MNSYTSKLIKNEFDHRLVELFTEQNPDNCWLTITDCARWVFETNEPSRYHYQYTKNKLVSLMGAPGTLDRTHSILDARINNAETGRIIFRLKDPSAINHSKKPQSLEEQINRVVLERGAHTSR